MTDVEKIEAILRHILNVQQNCLLLGKRLIEKGEAELGKALIANGLIHDNSKFFGVEWDYLDSEDKELQKIAISSHQKVNPHHPEYWGKIDRIPRLYLAELCCDWKARASEFGTSVHEWLENSATEKFGFTKNSKVYKEIKSLLKLLCDEPF